MRKDSAVHEFCAHEISPANTHSEYEASLRSALLKRRGFQLNFSPLYGTYPSFPQSLKTMPKRKSRPDEPEQVPSHKSKRAKTNNVTISTDDTKSSTEQVSKDHSEPQSIHAGRKTAKKAKSRARQQRREEISASKAALPERTEKDGDANISGQSHLQGKGHRKKSKRQDQGLSSGKNGGLETAQAERSTVDDDDATSRQYSQRAKKKSRKQGREGGKQVARGEAHAVKVGTQEGKNGVDASVDKVPAWVASEAVGGQMLDLDPLFSPDEE